MTRVLIVDDETEFSTTLAERLRIRRFDTEVSGCAEEAMEKLQGGWTPDVVVLDLKMPGLDGIKTLDLIKRHDPSIEVILLTGHGSTESGIAGMQRGLFDYLIKPVDIGELVGKIDEAARKRQA